MKKITQSIYRAAALSIFILQVLTGCNKSVTDNQNEVTSTTITAIRPTSAKSGDTVTVFGKNLPLDKSSVKVTINDKLLNIILQTKDSLEFTVPQGVGSGPVTINASGISFVGPEFTYGWKVIVTTVAGTGEVGNQNGVPGQASFYCPWGIVCDSNGDLYIADTYNRLIRKISAIDNTVYSTPIVVQNFASPYNLTINTNSGSLYVTDFNKDLLKISADGNQSVIFIDNMPLAGIALSTDGHLFIANNTLGTITKIDTNGQNRTDFVSGLQTPRNMFFDPEGSLYVSAYSGSLLAPVVNKIDSAGNVTVVASDKQSQGWEVVMNTSGEFFEADHFSNVIRKIDKNKKSTIIAGSGIADDVDGIGLHASFNGPQGIAIDSKGDLYVTTFNYDNNKGNKVRKIHFE